MPSSQQHQQQPRPSRFTPRMVTMLSIATACYLLSLASTSSPSSTLFFLAAEATPVPATKEQLRWIASQAVQVDQDPLSLILLPPSPASPLRKRSTLPFSSVANPALFFKEATSGSGKTRVVAKRDLLARAQEEGSTTSNSPRRQRSLYDAYEAIVNSDSQMPVFLPHDHITRQRQQHSKKAKASSNPEMIHSKPLRGFVRMVVPSSSLGKNQDPDSGTIYSDDDEGEVEIMVTQAEDEDDQDDEEEDEEEENGEEEQEQFGDGEVVEPINSADAPYTVMFKDDEQETVESLLDKASRLGLVDNDQAVVVTPLPQEEEQENKDDDQQAMIVEKMESQDEAVEQDEKEEEEADQGSLPSLSFCSSPNTDKDGAGLLSDDSFPALSEPEPPRELDQQQGSPDHHSGSTQTTGDAGCPPTAQLSNHLPVEGERSNSDDSNNNGNNIDDDQDDKVLETPMTATPEPQEQDEHHHFVLPPPATTDPLGQDDFDDPLDKTYHPMGPSSSPFGVPSSSIAATPSWSLIQWLPTSSSNPLLMGLALGVLYLGYRLYQVRRSTANGSSDLLPFTRPKGSGGRAPKGHSSPMAEKQTATTRRPSSICSSLAPSASTVMEDATMPTARNRSFSCTSSSSSLRNV